MATPTPISPRLWKNWYRTAVSHSCSRSGDSCPRSVCAAKAPHTVASASSTPAAASARLLFTVLAEERLDQVDRQREDDQLRALVGDVGERLQITQLQRARLAGQRLRR